MLIAALCEMEAELASSTAATKSSLEAQRATAIAVADDIAAIMDQGTGATVADLAAVAEARVGALDVERARAQALVDSLGKDMAALPVGHPGATAVMVIEGGLREAVAALRTEHAKAMALVKVLESEVIQCGSDPSQLVGCAPSRDPWRKTRRRETRLHVSTDEPHNPTCP